MADGARVAMSFSFAAAHEGEWMGLPWTGRATALPGADLLRVVAGKMAEIRVCYDTLGLMQQLDAARMPAEVAGARSWTGAVVPWRATDGWCGQEMSGPSSGPGAAPCGARSDFGR